MKRAFCLILLCAMLFSFSGCGRTDTDTVSFYYLREEYSYGAVDSVVVSEQRDISGRREDLNYLLRLYLAGPLDDALRSPFPKGTRLSETLLVENTLTVELSEEFSELQGVHLTLAGACIASTCFYLTDAVSVQIYSGEPGSKPLITLTRESLTLLDSSTQTTEATTAAGE